MKHYLFGSFFLIAVLFAVLLWWFKNPNHNQYPNVDALQPEGVLSNSSNRTGRIENKSEYTKDVKKVSIKGGKVLPRNIASPGDQYEEALRSLESASSRPWIAKHQSTSMVDSILLTEGKLPLNARDSQEAVNSFLKNFGERLFGVDGQNLTEINVAEEPDSTQYIYSQYLNGLVVRGARLSMVFDKESNLIFLSSDLARYNDLPEPSSAKISETRAAELGRGALVQELKRAQKPVSAYENLTTSSMGSGQLEYSLHGGAVNLCYRFVVLLSSPNKEEYEIKVDAVDSSNVSVRRLSKS